MIFPIHSDDNSEELTDGRHAIIIKVKWLSGYGPTNAVNTLTLYACGPQ